jgi:hypothetical protein
MDFLYRTLLIINLLYFPLNKIMDLQIPVLEQ